MAAAAWPGETGLAVAQDPKWLEEYERTHQPGAAQSDELTTTRGGAATAGIVAGVLSGLIIGVLTFFGPTLYKPEFGIIWFWFSWAIAPVAGIFGGFIIGGFVHHVMSRRVERALSRETTRPDLRDL